jgi:hypothetical protein
MTTDPAPYIIFAAALGASIGFFGCAIFASKAIKRANLQGWKECTRFYARRDAERRREARETATHMSH